MLFHLAVLSAAFGLQPTVERDLSNLPPPPECAFEGGATRFDSLAALPEHVRAAIGRLFEPWKGMADAGVPYRWGDVFSSTDPMPRTRFVRAYRAGGTWFLWYDAGGFGIMRQTLALVEERDPHTDQMRAGGLPGSRFSGDLCAGSKAFLAGARNPLG